MPDIKTDWSYPVMETTLDKRLERPGVQRGYSAEMTGVDGRSEGGLKPFPGFKLAHRFTQLQLQSNHGIASEILDLKAVDFRIGSEHYGYGFVYRARRSNDTKSDVFMDYWDSVNEAWTYCEKLMEEVDSDAQFDVQVAGRFVYTFIEGRSPALFYIEATRTKEYACEADTYIDLAATTTNYGSDLTLKIQGGGAATKNILWRFDTNAEADKTVESATLQFTISGNDVTATRTLSVYPVSDPGTPTNQLWEEGTATWALRKTAVNWDTAGGDFTAGSTATTSVGVGFLGRVSMSVGTLVQRCLSSLDQAFTAKTDLLGKIAGTAAVYVAGRDQANVDIRPKLTVTYTDKVFLTKKKVGNLLNSSLPGPGKKPRLKSPERGISAGSFTDLNTGEVGSAQVVLLTDDPYSNDANFPDQISGLCSGDTAPAAPAPTIPGTTFTPPAPTAGSCEDLPDAITDAGFIIQLLTPANRQTNVSVTPKLDWNVYFTDGQTLPADIRYDVYLVQDGLDALNDRCVANTLTTTSFQPASLWPTGKMPYNKKFLWKIVARRTLCDDFSVTSITGTFTTESRYQARKFEPGDYSFGYLLVDSKTGRRSAFSEVGQVRSEDFVVARTQNGTTISTKRDQYMGIELVYDSSKYDQMYVYRSVKIQDAGGTMIAGLPFLDAIVTLRDYHTCLNKIGSTFDPTLTDNRHAMYFYELEDKQLVYQSPYADRSIFDDKMPYGGAALFYQNTMLVSRVQTPQASTSDEARLEDSNRGLGEMRWSSLMEMSPELFPPFNRYNPTIPSNEVICFSKVGSNVVGISRDRVYHLRKSGPYIKVTEMHEGYGIVNHKAVDSVGSAAFYVASHGLKSVDVQGQLDEIRNLNSVFVREWRNDLTQVQVAHDPFMNCLFVHNPVQEESYVLWFATGKTTKLADANFDLVAQGPWPINWTSSEFGNDLCRRAFFLQNNQETRTSGTGYNQFAGPALYVVDQAASRTISGGSASWNGARRITTLDFAGDSRFVASGAWASGSIPITSATGTVVSTDAWKFAYAYLSHSTVNPANIGRKFKVMYNTATGVFVDSAVYPWVTSTVAGDVFVVSPIVFEWVGHPLGLSTEQGMVFSTADLFRMKVVSSVGAAFTDVSGPPVNDSVTSTKPLDRYTGLVYSGTAETPLATAQTKDTNGNLYASVEDDEGLVYAAFGSDASDGRYGVKGTSLNPGIRILCPDLDFRLLGCVVRGTITSVERTTNIRGS
jgi:hypothetical protein